jgi:hypothetical protein
MRKIKMMMFALVILFGIYAYGQDRVGTTGGNFLEIGYGTVGNSMGEAYVSLTRDLSSTYWNPAGIAYMKTNEVIFMYMPWIANMDIYFASIGFVLPNMGTMALSVYNMDYGEMDVTTMEFQEGTGERFSVSDLAFQVSYGRKLAQWFSFGASMKYINSRIWHCNAQAVAGDLGVIINTQFFSPTGKRQDGLNIGMSISNYGTKLQYDGMDLLRPIDIRENEAGNYSNVQGQFTLNGWELPLIYRIGISVNPISTRFHKLSLALDALHPNNNSESINIGSEYSLSAGSFGKLFLRGGYKGLFMSNNQFGLTSGFGMEIYMIGNKSMSLDYSFQDIKVLGNTQSFSMKMSF